LKHITENNQKKQAENRVPNHTWLIEIDKKKIKNEGQIYTINLKN
jgi:pyruvate/2-oxoglutarate/acetoin dehydrogenase E1 component